LYLAAALGLGAVLVLRAVQLRRDTSTARAWRFFKFSNVYLALLYAAMVADRLVALGNPRALLWSLITVLVLAGAGLILLGLNRAGWRGVLHHGTG
ncbi:MAG: hypothetical protein M3010_08290, partial [Candidatus Dormibacteraeota bacterium]|nr:hypothetical protein [Candidatus Dormibacteraeota bacterium]